MLCIGATARPPAAAGPAHARLRLQDRAAVHRAGGSGAILAWLRALLQIVASRCKSVRDDAVFLCPLADRPLLVIMGTRPDRKGRTFSVQGRKDTAPCNGLQGDTADLADH